MTEPLPDEPREMYCLTCAYPLRNLERRSCPECGAAFNPNDESTWSPVPFNPEHRKMARVAVGAFTGGCLTPVMVLMFVGFVMVAVIVIAGLLMELVRLVSEWIG